MKKPELLIPAGSLSVLKVAVMYGADAVYIGGEAFSLRANAKNFTLAEMKEGLDFAHERGVRVYITANIFAHNADLAEAEEYFKELSQIKPDGVLISDPGLFLLARRAMSNIDIHISTQANNSNYETFNFWYGLGVRRVVCARELSLDEISEIRKNIPVDMEIEAFVHGAMCISYSGRCLLSAYMTGRSANSGECTHPCRWKYTLNEESRPNEYMPVYENDRGTYIFNSKDLCMIEHLPEMIAAGIDSLKVEGRMKSALYVASVCRTYRMAIDDYFSEIGNLSENRQIPKKTVDNNVDKNSVQNEKTKKHTSKEVESGFVLPKKEFSEGKSTEFCDKSEKRSRPGTYSKNLDFYREEISKCTYREFTTGFFFGKPNETTQIYDASTYVKEWVYLGMISEDFKKYGSKTYYGLIQKNKFSVGETVEIMKPSGENIRAVVLDMEDEHGEKISACPHPAQHFYADFGVCLDAYDIIRINRI